MVCLITTVLMVAAAGGCGGGGGTTPRDTFVQFKNALTDKKFDEVWELLSKDSQAWLDAEAVRKRKHATEILTTGSGENRLHLKSWMKSMDLDEDDAKELDGQMLLAGMLRVASADDKDVWAELSRSKFAREEIEGDSAKVYVEFAGEVDESKPVPMVREDGKWKVALKRKPPKIPIDDDKEKS
jgi:hypothetical protein